MSNNRNRSPSPAPITTQAPQPVTEGTEDGTQTTQAPEPTDAPVVTEAPAVTEAPTEAPTPTEAPAPAATRDIVAEAALAAAEAAAAAPLPTPAPEQVELAKAWTFEERVDQALTQASPQVQNAVAQLRAYRETMKVRTVVSDADMARAQLGLWKTIRGIITGAPDFQLGFGLLIGFFREYGTQEFREQSVFRAMDTLALDADQLGAFQRVLNLLILASRSDNHAHTLRQVDLGKTLSENIYGDEGRNRVIQYFK